MKGAAPLLLSLFACATPSAGIQETRTPEAFYVVNTKGDSVSLVDLSEMRETRRIEVGKEPYGVVALPDGKRVAIGVEGEGKVKFFDSTDYRLLAEVEIGRMHHDHLMLTADQRYLLDANYFSDTVVGIDVKTMKEAFRIEGASAPHVVKYGPKRKHVYVTCKKITGIAVMDPVARKLVAFHQLKVNPRGLTFDEDETTLFFGSFWVDGFFEMDIATGKVTRLHRLPTPEGDSAPREVTYHGCEGLDHDIVLAANEGRSFVDAVNYRTGAHLDRFAGASKPCCIERIPGPPGAPMRVLISNIGDDSVQLLEVSPEGKMRELGKAQVGADPKRVSFVY